MNIAQSFTVTVEATEYHVLITTQGSYFKNAVVERIVTKLKEKPSTFR
jgi:predicted DCC family thiol-disulfide oxidoreductase YuxK